MRDGFTVHHNGPPASCVGQPHTRCVSFWAAVKRYHQQKWPRFNDIAYSFGVCPHGVTFEGRGWNRSQIANGTDVVGKDDGSNADWYTVLAFVGGGYWEANVVDGIWVPEEPVTAQMTAGISVLIDDGRVTGRCDMRILPHSDFKPKPCPGPTLTTYCRTWDRRVFPPPAPPPDEEMPEMFMYSSPGKPVFFCHAGASVGLNEATDRATFDNQGVPLFMLDDDTFEKFRQRFPGS